MFQIPSLDEHFGQIHQATNTLTDAATHARQGTSTAEISGSASGKEPVGAASGTSDQILQTAREAHADGGE